MGIVNMGPYCRRCEKRPAQWDDHCAACWLLLRAFGHTPEPVRRTRWDAWHAMGLAHPSDSQEFEVELDAWRAA